MFTENFSIITVLVFTVPFIFTVLIVWIKSIEKRKREQMKVELFIKTLEKGHPMPTDLFAISDKEDSPLRTGIILTLMGIGISFMLWLIIGGSAGLRIAVVGILPLLMGIAFLIIHFVEKRKKNQPDAQ